MEKMAEERAELVEYNRELQWTIMALKEANEKLGDHLEFAMTGGDIEELKNRVLKDAEADSAFKTPKVDNVFDMYDEFQPASAAVKTFSENPEDDETPLRKSTTDQAKSPDASPDAKSPDGDSPAASPDADVKSPVSSPSFKDDQVASPPADIHAEKTPEPKNKAAQKDETGKKSIPDGFPDSARLKEIISSVSKPKKEDDDADEGKSPVGISKELIEATKLKIEKANSKDAPDEDEIDGASPERKMAYDYIT